MVNKSVTISCGVSVAYLRSRVVVVGALESSAFFRSSALLKVKPQGTGSFDWVGVVGGMAGGKWPWSLGKSDKWKRIVRIPKAKIYIRHWQNKTAPVCLLLRWRGFKDVKSQWSWSLLKCGKRLWPSHGNSACVQIVVQEASMTFISLRSLKTGTGYTWKLTESYRVWSIPSLIDEVLKSVVSGTGETCSGGIAAHTHFKGRQTVRTWMGLPSHNMAYVGSGALTSTSFDTYWKWVY